MSTNDGEPNKVFSIDDEESASSKPTLDSGEQSLGGLAGIPDRNNHSRGPLTLEINIDPFTLESRVRVPSGNVLCANDQFNNVFRAVSGLDMNFSQSLSLHLCVPSWPAPDSPVGTRLSNHSFTHTVKTL